MKNTKEPLENFFYLTDQLLEGFMIAKSEEKDMVQVCSYVCLFY